MTALDKTIHLLTVVGSTVIGLFVAGFICIMIGEARSRFAKFLDNLPDKIKEPD